MANTPGVANATPNADATSTEPSTTDGSPAGAATGASATGTAEAPKVPSGSPGSDGGSDDPGDDAGDDAGAMKVDATGGSITSTTPGSAGAALADDGTAGTDTDTTTDRDTPAARVKSGKSDFESSPVKPAKRASTAVSASNADTGTPPSARRSASAAADSVSTRAVAPSVPRSTQPPAALTSDMAAPQAVSAFAEAPVAPSSVVSQLASTMMSLVGWNPSAAGGGPVTPGESPVSLVLLGAWRRLSQQSLAGESSTTASDSTQTSLKLASTDTGGAQPMMALAATAVNAAPTASPTVNAPDDVNAGKVTGSLNATDPEGSTLTYAVTGTPANGAVTVDGAGNYAYTPTQAVRLAASQTPGADTDSFTVTVSDGQASTPVAVTVPISSMQTSLNAPTTVGTNPSALALSGNYAYLANQGSNTVSVIDTRTGQLVDTNLATPTVVDPITVGTSPAAVVATSNGKVYVANSGSGTVSVISTSTNKVTKTIQVGSSPQGLAVSPDGSKVYVANSGSGTVSVISTSSDALVDVNPVTWWAVDSIAVGSSPTGLAVSPDGSRLYVANKGSGTVSVINTASYGVTNTITAGTQPTSLAVSPDNKSVYATNTGSSTVTVIDATNAATNAYTVRKTVAVGTSPSSVKFSPDGSLAYVANGNDSISVIDTRSTTVTRTLAIDPAAETGGHSIALSADGNTIYVTDAVDRNVRVLKLAHVNSAPTPKGLPTVTGTDSTTGAVTGSVNVTDIDGDKLTFATAPNTGPASGTVTYGEVTGTYTYTPTDAARQQAAQTSTEDYDHFTVNVGDGQATTAVPVTVVISPKAAVPPPPSGGAPTTTPIPVGSNPNGVAVAGNQAYVVNADSTVSVIDTTSGQVVKTIAVGYAPTRATAAPDGKRVYVANYDSVSVIDTSTNTVAATIYVPNECGECYNGVYDVVVSPDSKRAYAAVGDGSISVIDTDPTHTTTYNKVISTSNVGVWDGDLEISGDGRRLYAGAPTDDAVYVIDTSTMTVTKAVHVGPAWNADAFHNEVVDSTYNVAVSPDGNRLYVTERVLVVDRGVGGQTSGWFITDDQGRNWLVTGTYSAVSVIDTNPASATYNTEIGRITVPAGAYDVAFSPDGSTAYVTHSDGKSVTMIDTRTNQVIRTFTTDQSSNAVSRRIAVGGNGKLYVTDSADNLLYVTSFTTV
ncbi:YncE family protein [Mycobacterium sp. URHB0044]|uniref:YncE family protein n=1 Tax=Mycobacterium sp. URHB0044 TaxID=1380386 RepID=UPI0018CC32B8|nr:beta-propeller fold lactonase family protein [Mycobacterium sp. URHB0044]